MAPSQQPSTLPARLAYRIQPRLATLTGFEHAATLFNTYFLIYAAPLAVVGLLLLGTATDVALIVAEWPYFLLLLALQLLLGRLPFAIEYEFRPGALGSAGGSLTAIVTWSGYFLFGPTALWITVCSATLDNLYSWLRARHPLERWSHFCSWVLNLSEPLLAVLSALWVYGRLDGPIPLESLTWRAAGAAAGAFAVYILFSLLFGLPLGRVMQALSGPAEDGTSSSAFSVLVLSVVGLTRVAAPFALLAPPILLQFGLGPFLLYMLGALSVSILAHSLSETAARAQQRARELASLADLGRDLLTGLPDSAALPALLQKHVIRMFPQGKGTIWLWPAESLFSNANPDQETLLAQARAHLEAARTAPLTEPVTARGPNTARFSKRTIEAVPILSDDGSALGGVLLLFPGSPARTAAYRSAMQSLAAEVATALERAEAYREALAGERMRQELAVAGRIQQSFLPAKHPQVAGWTVSAALVPARETSGDFYDFIELGNGRLGLVVADVADKGTGAALFMALSRTLLRTYALQHPADPALVLQAANARILADTVTDQFVTVCYVIVETRSGAYAYASAGHNPAYLLAPDAPLAPLGQTGPPLGVMPGLTWRQQSGNLPPGGRLVIYSDGVTEAQNGAHEEFGEARLQTLLLDSRHRPVADIQAAILEALTTFAAGAPQFDDITLLIADHHHPAAP